MIVLILNNKAIYWKMNDYATAFALSDFWSDLFRTGWIGVYDLFQIIIPLVLSFVEFWMKLAFAPVK